MVLCPQWRPQQLDLTKENLPLKAGKPRVTWAPLRAGQGAHKPSCQACEHRGRRLGYQLFVDEPVRSQNRHTVALQVVLVPAVQRQNPF